MSKSSLAALFGSDPNKEVNGVVVQYGTIKIRLARQGGANKKFAKLFEEKARPWRPMIDAGMLPPDVAQKIMHEAFSEGIVMAWDGVTDDDGVAIPFTVENACAQFEKYPGFFAFCHAESGKLANYRTVEAEETDTKN